MKKLLILLLLTPFALLAQSPIEDFDKVMQAYNEAYTSTTDEKEQQEINAKYEILIAEAEKEFEKAIEKEFQEQKAQLEKEQSELLIIEDDEGDNNNDEDDDEDNDNESDRDEKMTGEQIEVVNFIIDKLKLKNKDKITGKTIAGLFLKTNPKNGYSTEGLGELFEVSVKGKEIDIANRVAEKIKKLQ